MDNLSLNLTMRTTRLKDPVIPNKATICSMAVLSCFSFSSSSLRAEDPNPLNDSVKIKSVYSKVPAIKSHTVWKVADPVSRNSTSMGSHLGASSVMCWSNDIKTLSCIVFGKTNTSSWSLSGNIIDDIVPGTIRDALKLDNVVVVSSDYTKKETQERGYIISFLNANDGSKISSQIFSAGSLKADEFDIQQKKPTRFNVPKFIKNNDDVYLVSDEGIIKIDPEKHTARTVASVDRMKSEAACMDWTFVSTGIFARVVKDDPVLSSVGKVVKVKDSGGFLDLDIYQDKNVGNIGAINGNDLLISYKPQKAGSSSTIARVSAVTLKELWGFDAGRLYMSSPLSNSTQTNVIPISVSAYLNDTSNDTEHKYLTVDASTGKAISTTKKEKNSAFTLFYNPLSINGSEYMLSSSQQQGAGGTTLSFIPSKFLLNSPQKASLDVGSIQDGTVQYVSSTSDGILICIQGSKSYKNGLILLIPDANQKPIAQK